jgi:hypothetical protein
VGSPEELSLDESLLSNDEGGRRNVFSIGQTLITTLGFSNGDFEFLVKFVQIDNEVFC